MSGDKTLGKRLFKKLFPSFSDDIPMKLRICGVHVYNETFDGSDSEAVLECEVFISSRGYTLF